MYRAIRGYYGEYQYENIYEKTAALVQGIILFHPFTDGNKRTALLSAYFFLLSHGYKFNIVYEEVLDIFIDIADEEIQDIETIADWIEKNSTRIGLIPRFLLFVLRLKTDELRIDEWGKGINLGIILRKLEKAWPK